ncbi:hypothetical protein SAY86_032154 [Trapa natans]|uniref:Late embryogenesis abundant protein LEA-2 subgroup domain-containing protein n=1 Tax=Trapa natans TaxID=22666 RepID=A0AAN7LSJ7_TRANT|nr:hypothetical protein SAY86_032154 [Trapa natans]
MIIRPSQLKRGDLSKGHCWLLGRFILSYFRPRTHHGGCWILNHLELELEEIERTEIGIWETVFGKQQDRNRDYFSLYYDSLRVSVGYRDRELGLVTSEGERIRARGSSYVNATLDLNGLEVLHDVFYLIQDLAKGVVPFDTVTQVKGDLGLFFFSLPIKDKLCMIVGIVSGESIMREASEEIDEEVKEIVISAEEVIPNPPLQHTVLRYKLAVVEQRGDGGNRMPHQCGQKLE